MTTQEIVKLMLKSSDSSPYSGKLSKKDNIKAAIALAYLCLDFAEKGHSDEAMNICSDQWREVIHQLDIGYMRDIKLKELLD